MADKTNISWTDKTFNPLHSGGVLISGFPAYAVTKDGRIWTRYRRGGKGKRAIGEVWMEKKPFISNRGHLRVELHEDGIRQKFFVHCLVLEAFVGECPDGMQCCHNDGNPKNNNISNLRWGTAVENWQDKRLHGTATLGSRQGQAKLVESDVVQILRMREHGAKLKDIASKFGVSVAKIGQITTGKNWRHVHG